MLTLKRLYLYSVLGVALLLLLRGLTDLVRLGFERFGDALGARSYIGEEFFRADLSWALALVIVATPIWVVHLWLVRRTLRGPVEAVAGERACASRATYFLLVLAGTGIATGMYLFDASQQVVASVTLGDRPWGLAGALAGFVVVGAAWALHLHARRFDLKVAPEHTAGDWLTRLYLYGALFITAVIGCIAVGNVLTVVGRLLLDLQPAWQSPLWWREEITWPLAATIVAMAGWLTHWSLASRLLRASPPMGESHRASQTRSGYFLAVVLVAATAVLVLASLGFRHAATEIFGAWRPTDGSRLIEDVLGPLVMAVPFLAVWWWHLRRATAEAFAFGGPARGRATRRSGRLVVAFVGLSGLAVGLAWELQALLDAAAGSDGSSLLSTTSLRDAGAPAMVTALLGLMMWTPAWGLSQRDRMRDLVETAAATARRAYLFLVSGLAVLAGMASLAFLVYQATRLLLGTDLADDSSWALAVLVVAAVVLAYHLWCLRADMLVDQAQEVLTSEADLARVVETIEISAPAGADFKVLNAAIRTELPEGYELHVHS
jgi:hypothetical protein